MYVPEKILKSVLLAICIWVGLWSCTDDQPDSSPVITGDEATVTLSIHTPSGSLPKATRSSEEDECAISAVKVLVMELNGTSYRFRYMVDGEQITQHTSNNQYTTFTARLKNSDVPLKLILIANANDAFTANQLIALSSEEEVRNLLSDTFSPETITGKLPMWGEVSVSSLQTDQTNVLSATLLRSIARVDVFNEVDNNVSGPFAIKSLHIFRANDQIASIPDPSTLDPGSSLRVTAPTVPSGAAFRSSYYTKTVQGDATYINKFYVPEAKAVTDTSQQLLGTTCVVVGGVYADDTEATYYRINFNSGIEGHPFGQILRNHKYIFNILEVSGRGWETPEEAANNEATLITASVQIWDEATSEMYYSDGDNYLGISSRKFTLAYQKGAEEIGYLQTTQPFTIQALDDTGNPAGPAISSNGESLQNGFYDLQIVKSSEDGADVYRLVMTATDDNLTDNTYSGRYLVSTRFWKFEVTVEQLTYLETYRTRAVNVLTITSLPGDLGTSDGIFTDGVSGDAMRRVLENKANFSPSGTVPIKEIIVHSFTNDMLSTSNQAYLDILSKMLEHVEVVHLPADCTPSVQASQLIYDWLEAKYYRVLILGLDDPSTNANMRQYFNALDGNWQYSEKAVTSLSTTPFWEDRHEPYFNGPFGPISDVSNVEVVMGYVSTDVGYNDGYNWDTTIPLLVVSSGLDNSGKMTHGINQEMGVFYCGESEITSARGQAMSSSAAANGTVDSPFDRLMANIWAWIIDRVVVGKE
ncbi:MAG: hypothetical protein LIP08_12055 [Bacteroides sp.]|nr:hypothetical protein [Bacteroides sp.]